MRRANLVADGNNLSGGIAVDLRVVGEDEALAEVEIAGGRVVGGVGAGGLGEILAGAVGVGGEDAVGGVAAGGAEVGSGLGERLVTE